VVFLHFVLVQEHVRDSILDREPASRLWTYEVTLQNMNFEEKVVEFFQHVDVCFDTSSVHLPEISRFFAADFRPCS
jgi:hypothetical protein